MDNLLDPFREAGQFKRFLSPVVAVVTFPDNKPGARVPRVILPDKKVQANFRKRGLLGIFFLAGVCTDKKYCTIWYD